MSTGHTDQFAMKNQIVFHIPRELLKELAKLTMELSGRDDKGACLVSKLMQVRIPFILLGFFTFFFRFSRASSGFQQRVAKLVP